LAQFMTDGLLAPLWLMLLGPFITVPHLAHMQHCGKRALHPTDAAARQQHLAECALRHERLAARARSAAVECGICLEPVLAKAAPADRKFGLLTGCDHPFCLRCIRAWRQNTDGGADLESVRAAAGRGRGWAASDVQNTWVGAGLLPVALLPRAGNFGCCSRLACPSFCCPDPSSHVWPTGAGACPSPQALRTCPLCRTTSHYIVPSLVWPTSSEEKERIVAGELPLVVGADGSLAGLGGIASAALG
jgi:hypothetical protein